LTEERYDLKESKRSIRELYPVLRDAHGNVIDGFHRLEIDPAWHDEILYWIKTPTQLWLARIIANTHRRKVSREERAQQILELAKSLVENDKVPKEEIVSTIAELTTFTERYVRELLPDEYKMISKARFAELSSANENITVPMGTPEPQTLMNGARQTEQGSTPEAQTSLLQPLPQTRRRLPSLGIVPHVPHLRGKGQGPHREIQGPETGEEEDPQSLRGAEDADHSLPPLPERRRRPQPHPSPSRGPRCRPDHARRVHSGGDAEMSLEELLDRKIDFLRRLLAEIDELQDLIKDSFIFSVEEVTQTYTRYYRDHLIWHGCYAIGHLTGPS